ncbi:MAG TPA: CBS domain-containing protein [Candidatus Dormibacteraeota bacterium]|nr:CBS domain-containing protein [Candidatus Dormibacteraeota bacterium]
MKVETIFRPGVVSAHVDENLKSAATRMRAEDISALAVVEAGSLVGILTERDLVQAIADGADPEVTPVASYASFRPAAAEPDEDIRDVAARMLELGVRHLPVVRGTDILGMISARDLLAHETWRPRS